LRAAGSGPGGLGIMVGVFVLWWLGRFMPVYGAGTKDSLKFDTVPATLCFHAKDAFILERSARKAYSCLIFFGILRLWKYFQPSWPEWEKFCWEYRYITGLSDAGEVQHSPGSKMK
jgi:hypothetical protein